MRQVDTGATYLQVIIIILFALFVVGPLAYIAIRNFCREFRKNSFEG